MSSHIYGFIRSSELSISDMIKKVETGEAIETKLVISEETYFEAATITEEDIATYGLGE